MQKKALLRKMQKELDADDPGLARRSDDAPGSVSERDLLEFETRQTAGSIHKDRADIRGMQPKDPLTQPLRQDKRSRLTEELLGDNLIQEQVLGDQLDEFENLINPLRVLKRREEAIRSGRPGDNANEKRLIDRGYNLDDLDDDNPFTQYLRD